MNTSSTAGCRSGSLTRGSPRSVELCCEPLGSPESVEYYAEVASDLEIQRVDELLARVNRGGVSQAEHEELALYLANDPERAQTFGLRITTSTVMAGAAEILAYGTAVVIDGEL